MVKVQTHGDVGVWFPQEITTMMMPRFPRGKGQGIIRFVDYMLVSKDKMETSQRWRAPTWERRSWSIWGRVVGS